MDVGVGFVDRAAVVVAVGFSQDLWNMMMMMMMNVKFYFFLIIFNISLNHTLSPFVFAARSLVLLSSNTAR